jgi:hypothetical protein
MPAVIPETSAKLYRRIDLLIADQIAALRRSWGIRLPRTDTRKEKTPNDTGLFSW